jgi:hypothetical protein
MGEGPGESWRVDIRNSQFYLIGNGPLQSSQSDLIEENPGEQRGFV